MEAEQVQIKGRTRGLILKKLDDLELELLKLRAELLPKERMTKKLKKLMEEAERDIKMGDYVTGNEFIKKLG